MSKALDDYFAEEHKSDPEALDAVIAERDRWREADPRDIDAVRVFPGALVQYACEDLTYPWTPKRWGIATGLIVTDRPEGGIDVSVRVTEMGTIMSTSSWYCDPVRLRVLNEHVTP